MKNRLKTCFFLTNNGKSLIIGPALEWLYEKYRTTKKDS